MSKFNTISDSDLRDLLLNPKLNRRGQYICDCPFCGKEKHFYISKTTQLFDCKKCGEYGNIYKLLKQVDKIYLLEGSTIEDRDKLLSIKQWLSEELAESIAVNLPVKKMPIGFKVSTKSTEYLIKRGVTPADCVRYNIGCTDMLDKFKGYVLIPIYDNSLIRGFVGRYGNENVPHNRLRYNNSHSTNFSSLLFGYDEITSSTSTVILVEGIFDKISTDKFLKLWDSDDIKCVCTFGKKISEEQRNKLLAKGVSNVVLLYDFDAIKETKKYGLELEKYFVTSITYTTKKDIDECTTSEALEVFSKLQKPKEFAFDVVGKIKR